MTAGVLMVMGMLSVWRELKAGAMLAATAADMPPLPLLDVGDVVLCCCWAMAELSDAGT